MGEGRSGAPLGDVSVDDPRQHDQRHVAVGDQGVVEPAEVEARAQSGLRRRPQAIDLAVADLVAAGLAGPGAIAINLALDVAARAAVGGREPVDGVLTRPPLGMEAGVDDEAARAKGDRLEVAEAAERIACSRVQRLAWRPVSTTRRQARKASDWR